MMKTATGRNVTAAKREMRPPTSLDSWVVTKEATASEQGSREKACQVCGYTVTEVISATGSDDVPKTGDENNIVLWASML